MADTSLTVTTRAKDLASKVLASVGREGSKAGESIAAGFIKAQLALGALKVAVKGVVNLVQGLTNEVGAEGDQIAKMSRRLGIATETLSAFGYVANLGGSSMESMGNALKFLAKNAYDASIGTGEAKDAFKELNVTVTGADKRLKSVEDLFFAVSDKLGTLEDKTKRAALAQRIFGRSGLEIIPIIDQGTAAIRAQIGEAERFGIVWGQSAAEIAEAYDDSKTRLDAAIKGIKIAVGTQLLPALTSGLNRIANYIAENRDTIATTVIDAIDAVSGFAFDAVAFMVDLGERVSSLVDKLDNLFSRGVNAKNAMEGFTAGGKFGVSGEKKKKTPLSEQIREAGDAFSETLRYAKIDAALASFFSFEVAKKAGNAAGEAYVDGIAESVGDAIAAGGTPLAKITENFVREIEMLAASSDLERATLRLTNQIADAISSADFGKATEAEIAGLYETLYKFDEAARGLLVSGALEEFFNGVADGAAAAAAQVEKVDAALEAFFAFEGQAKRSDPKGFLEGMGRAFERVGDLSQMLDDLGQTLVFSTGRGFADFFDTIVSGTASAGDALRSFGLTVTRAMADIATQFLAVQLLKSAFGMFGVSFGAPAAGAGVPATAAGGIVTGPQVRLVGEAGPEAIIPLSKGGDYGLGGGDINVTVNAPTGVDVGAVKAMAKQGVLEALSSDYGYRKSMQGRLRRGI